MTTVSIVCLGGGVGATRLWRALAAEVGPSALTVVVNTADDLWCYGLRVCPDLDTVIYGLAGRQDAERGWGLQNESFVAMSALEELGETVWFNLGDRDLATHLLRTRLLRDGATLSDVTNRLASLNSIAAQVLPMCDEEVNTEVLETGRGWTPFQEFHVKHRAQPHVDAVRYVGIEEALTPPAVLAAIESASLIIIGPSSPIASVMPILGVGRTREALRASGAPVVGITPIVSGAPLTDSGDAHRALCRERLMSAHGLTHRASDAATLYADLVDFFVVDEVDTEEAEAIEALGLRPIVAPTLIHVDPAAASQLPHIITSLAREPTRAAGR